MRGEWFRIVIYVLGAWISKERCAEPWIVGPVFGAVVLAWNATDLRALARPKSLVFLALSTLIYALVFFIADSGWKLEPEWLDWLAGSLPLGVAAGSILLPLAHPRLLGGGAPPIRTSLALAASFYAATGIGGLLDRYAPFDFDYYAVAVFLWQGLYLGFFYASRIRKAFQFSI